MWVNFSYLLLNLFIAAPSNWRLLLYCAIKTISTEFSKNSRSDTEVPTQLELILFQNYVNREEREFVTATIQAIGNILILLCFSSYCLVALINETHRSLCVICSRSH